MTKRLLTSSVLVCALTLLTVSSALAQIRPERTFYLVPRVGLTHYNGDFNSDGLDFDGDGVPLGGGLELGYQFTRSAGISAFGFYGNYPAIIPDIDDEDVDVVAGLNYPIDYGQTTIDNSAEFYSSIAGYDLTGTEVGDGDAETERLTIGALLRFTGNSTSRISPTFAVGLQGTGEGAGLAIGPVGAIGLDFALSDRASLLFDLMVMAHAGDENLDFAEADPFTTSFDLTEILGLGLKWNFRSALAAPVVGALDCPDDLVAGQSATFSAAVNADGGPTYRWAFGDGQTASGTMATHTFNNPGTYTVTFTAENRSGVDTETCVVTVERDVEGPSISSITANRMAFDVCEPVTVTFNANVTGTEPLEFEWDFDDDGADAEGRSVTHVFDEAGTYNVTLTVRNEAGTDTERITITANECRAGICFEITEMNCAFFPRNSSELTAEARAALRENLEIFEECPNLCGRIEGYAAPGERNPQALSEARAQAIADFYEDNGIAASRFTTVGLGVPAGVTTTKKEGVSQYRRACTIPVQCEDLR